MRWLSRHWLLVVVPLIVLVFVVPAFWWWSARPSTQIDSFVPDSWRLTSASGSIAWLCLGGATECGTIKRTYLVSDPATAMAELERETEARGLEMSAPQHPYNWNTRTYSDGLTTSVKGHDWSAGITVEGRSASLQYIHR